MNKIKWPYFVGAIVLGVLMVVYGGYDDSPGGQILGLLMVIGGVVGVIKSRRKN